MAKFYIEDLRKQKQESNALFSISTSRHILLRVERSKSDFPQSEHIQRQQGIAFKDPIGRFNNINEAKKYARKYARKYLKTNKVLFRG